MQKSEAQHFVCDSRKTGHDEQYFPPVRDFTAVRLILALAAKNKRYRKHFDFQNAFSNGKLNRPVYVKLPTHIVCILDFQCTPI